MRIRIRHEEYVYERGEIQNSASAAAEKKNLSGPASPTKHDAKKRHTKHYNHGIFKLAKLDGFHSKIIFINRQFCHRLTKVYSAEN